MYLAVFILMLSSQRLHAESYVVWAFAESGGASDGVGGDANCSNRNFITGNSFGTTYFADTVNALIRSFTINGRFPTSLVVGENSILYGTTTDTVFKISNNSGENTFSVLHSFVNSEGYSAGLIQGKDGVLYGTTSGEGMMDNGTVFKINTDGSGYSILHSFSSSGGDGRYPRGRLTQGTDGTLYGTTSEGGVSGKGTVFKISTDGIGYSIMHSFANSGDDGSDPEAGLLLGTDGALYGTTLTGGTSKRGVVYKISTGGDGSFYSILHSFSDSSSDGFYPYAGLIQGNDGALYGTTSLGGASDGGTVFKISTDGIGYSTLHSFSIYGDGYFPGSGLIQGSDGALYGTTTDGGSSGGGVLFSVGADGSVYTVLYSFPYSAASDDLGTGGLFQGSKGTVYGVTGGGGADGGGVIYSYSIPGPLDHFVLTLACTETNAASFTGANTLTAKDAAENTIAIFNASANNVTISVNSPLSGTISGLHLPGQNILNLASDFDGGVADLTALGMTYTGNAATGTFSATSADGKIGTSGKVTIIPIAPSFSSQPSATPNPATAQQAVLFEAASNQHSDTLSYHWDFGDGTAATGSSVLHAYVSPGTFNASVIALSANNSAAVGSVSVVVNPARSTPLTVSKLSGKVNYDVYAKDVASISGVISNVPEKFDPTGQTISLNISGAEATFTLNERGQAKSASGVLVLHLTRRNRKARATAFQAKLKGVFADIRSTIGIGSSSIAKSALIDVKVKMSFNGDNYVAIVRTFFTNNAKNGKFIKK